MFANGARSWTARVATNLTHNMPMQEHVQPPMAPMPYGYYPSPYPYHPLPPYYPMQASMGFQPGTMEVPPQAGSNLMYPITMQTQSLQGHTMVEIL